MFEKLKESKGNVIGFLLTGKLTDADYKAEFHGWEPKPAWDDYEYWRKYGKDIDRVAIVGEKLWEEWMTKLAKLFMRGNVKYFDQKELDDAWALVREGAQT